MSAKAAKLALAKAPEKTPPESMHLRPKFASYRRTPGLAHGPSQVLTLCDRYVELACAIEETKSLLADCDVCTDCKIEQNMKEIFGKKETQDD